MKSNIIKILLFFLVTTLFISGCSRRNQKIKVVTVAAPEVRTPKHNIDRFGVDAKDSTSTMIYHSNGKRIATIYFNFDRYDIRPNMKSLISKDAKLLNSAKMANAQILLEGNCDELGSNAYNKSLGLKRAKSVKSALHANGVNLNRMSVISYGKSNPTCTSSSQTCHAKNRRVNIVIK